MKRAKIVLLVALALFAAIAMAMPRNSYLVRPAKTHAELMRQIRTEPVVADRYMRHFGMTRDEMLSFIGELRLGRLDKTGVYNIYGVPKNGQIHATPQLLRRGALVWENESGQPILLEICGNPFTQGPKRTTMSDVISVAPTEPTPIVAMSTFPTEPVQSVPVAVTMQPVTPTAPMPLPIDPVVEPTVFRRDNLGWLLVLPAAAAIAVREGETEQPVPEPATMTAIAVGASLLALRRRKKNKV